MESNSKYSISLKKALYLSLVVLAIGIILGILVNHCINKNKQKVKLSYQGASLELTPTSTVDSNSISQADRDGATKSQIKKYSIDTKEGSRVDASPNQEDNATYSNSGNSGDGSFNGQNIGGTVNINNINEIPKLSNIDKVNLVQFANNFFRDSSLTKKTEIVVYVPSDTPNPNATYIAEEVKAILKSDHFTINDKDMFFFPPYRGGPKNEIRFEKVVGKDRVVVFIWYHS